MDQHIPRRLSPIDEAPEALLSDENDDSTIEEIPRNPPTEATSFESLPNELLGQIIAYLDPDSAVSLALTCPRNHNTVLEACGVRNLNQVCPRDVRARFPPLLEHHALNIMERNPDDNNPWSSWQISNHNYRDIPEDVLALNLYHPHEARLLSEHLAVHRQCHWASGLRNIGLFWPVPRMTPLFVAYATTRLVLGSQEECIHEWAVFWRHYDHLVIESVEFMRLRRLLGPRWIQIAPDSPLAIEGTQEPTGRKWSLRRGVRWAVRKVVGKLRAWRASRS